MAATESPPPIRLKAPLLVAFAIARATDVVPLANLSISKTPIGPFQRIVLEFSITSSKILMDSSAISNPIQPSGVWSILDTCVFALASKASAFIASTGKYILTPFSFAFFRISKARSSLSSSQSDFPIFPPWALMKVYVIPPPIITLSTRLSKFSIIRILSDTFAPPIMAVKGFCGAKSTLSMALSSLPIKKPNMLSLGKYAAIKAVEACARWAVPNASFT